MLIKRISDGSCHKLKAAFFNEQSRFVLCQVTLKSNGNHVTCKDHRTYASIPVVFRFCRVSSSSNSNVSLAGALTSIS